MFICTDQLLIPALVKFNIKSKLVFDAIWTGAYCTFAREKDRNNIYVFGLNNYRQLGLCLVLIDNLTSNLQLMRSR